MIAPALLDPALTRARLQEAAEAGGWDVVDVRSVAVVQERPGKRRVYRYAVVCARGGREREAVWYGKEFSGAKAEKVWHAHKFLGTHLAHKLLLGTHRSEGGGVVGVVVVPELIGFSSKARLVVTAALEGPTVESALAGSALEQEKAALGPLLRSVGAAVAGLHQSLGPDSLSWLPTHGPRDESLVLRSAFARAAASSWSSTLIRRFENLTDAVVDDLDSASRDRPRLLHPDRPRLLHRDLHPGQIRLVMEANGAIGLTDLDELALGEPELDLGNLAAHFFLSDLQRDVVGAAPQRIEWLLRGYLEFGSWVPVRLATYTASALLRLASLERLASPDRSRIGWTELARGLIDIAERECTRHNLPL